MKQKLTGVAASMGALLIAATACGGGADGPPLGDSYSNGGDSSSPSVAYVLRDWQEPCETFDFEELAEWFDYVDYRGEGKINSPYGVGMDQPAVMCQALVNYTKFTNDRGHERAGEGLLSVAVIPWEDEEQAAADFASRVEMVNTSYDDVTVDTELPGDWDESVYLQGKVGLDDEWDLLARDGLYILWVRVSISPDPSGGEGEHAFTWTVDDVSAYLRDTYFEQEHQLIETALQEAGADNG